MLFGGDFMKKLGKRSPSMLVVSMMLGAALCGMIALRICEGTPEYEEAEPPLPEESESAEIIYVSEEIDSEEADSDDNDSLEQVSYDVTVNPAQDPSIAPVLPDDYSRWTEDQKTRLNLFLSNFSEVYMPSFTPAYATGAELLWYVDRHLFINNNSEISYSSDNAQRFSNASAQNCLERYFGVSLEPKDYSGIVSGAQRSYKYIDGYFCNYS